MNELKAFSFAEGRKVRTLERDGEVWFVAKDVCDILGLGNARKAISNFPEDERNTVTTGDGIQEGPGNPNVNIINEPGLYRLIFQSRKPEAEEFKRWVFHVVLPAIRKQGFYAPPELMEWFEKYKNLPEQFEKFKGYAIEAYKKLEARVEGAYKEVLDNAAANAAAEVKEYLLSSHRPSAYEAQLADLKNFLAGRIVFTGDRRDKVWMCHLYGSYKLKYQEKAIPEDAFAAHVQLLYPQVKLRGGQFYGVHFDY
jgi:prophage antirepressor-like protein